jgi:iron complex transport system substrate-binding protein
MASCIKLTVATLILLVFSIDYVSAEHGQSFDKTDSSRPSVTIVNDGFTTNYKTVPKRAVTMNQSQTEIMLALGLEAHMVGTAYIDDEILPEFEAVYNTIPVLAKKYPSKEILLNAAPDFIYAGYPSAFSERRGLPTRNELLKIGINSYLSPGSCKGMITKKKPWSMEVLYKELLDIATIFRVTERAEELISAMEKDIGRIRLEKNPGTKIPWILWLDNFSDRGPYVGSGNGPINAIINLAGGKNSFHDIHTGKTHAIVSKEQIISRPIDYVVLTEAVWSSSQKKKQGLTHDPIYSTLEAIKNNKFVPIEFSASTGGIRTVSAIKKLSTALHNNNERTKK